MGHLSAYRRMLIWVIGTIMVLVATLRFLLFGMTIISMFPLVPLEPLLFLGGWVIIIVNELVFGVRKEQREIDRDETIKGSGEKHPHSPMVLAICPQCKSRIPSDSKYCLECGTDLQRQTS